MKTSKIVVFTLLLLSSINKPLQASKASWLTGAVAGTVAFKSAPATFLVDLCSKPIVVDALNKFKKIDFKIDIVNEARNFVAKPTGLAQLITGIAVGVCVKKLFDLLEK